MPKTGRTRQIAVDDWEKRSMTEATYIVIGVPRSGTSMVAGILRILGIYMGENIKPGKHEDTDILWQQPPKIIKTIKHRNATQKVWGFKDPNCARYIGLIEPYLINPRYIYIKRSLPKTVESDLRRGQKSRRHATRRNTAYKSVYDTIEQKRTCLSLEYDIVVACPTETVDLISQFCGNTATKEQRSRAVEFIQPGDYRDIKEGNQ